MLQRGIGTRILRQTAEKSQAYTLKRRQGKQIISGTGYTTALNLALPDNLK